MPLVRVCRACTGVYERELTTCPYCGHVWEPAARSTPDAVDGDLIELDAEALAELREAAERAVMGDDEARGFAVAKHMPPIGVLAHVKRQRITREAQAELRLRIAEIAGQWRADGAEDPQIYRRFYLRYGIDVLSACALKSGPALELLGRMTT